MDLGVLVVRLDLPRGKRDPVNLTCPRVLSGAEIGPRLGHCVGSPSSYSTISDQGEPFIWKRTCP